MHKKLVDKFGRVHNYLRLSLTDKCNLRCTYCMPASPSFLPNNKLLSKQEIIEIASLFVDDYGINKIRFTGGEPLIRKDAAEIMEKISHLPVELAITTNGVYLHDFLSLFRKINLTSINISLDSLDQKKYKTLTLRNHFNTVIQNIEKALSLNFNVKINVVVIKGTNHDEILNFVEWTRFLPIHIRFIEFMPFDGNKWQWEKVYPYKRMLEAIQTYYPIHKLFDKPNSTAKCYQVNSFKGTFAVISSVTKPFCNTCNRLRLTADGKLRNCLFANSEWDVLTPLRSQKSFSSVIEKAVLHKEKQCGGLVSFNQQQKLLGMLSDRSMVKIGG